MNAKRDTLIKKISDKLGEDGFVALRDQNYNENLANVVLNRLSTNKIYDAPDRLVQKADPIFTAPGSKYGRAHFFAPYKQIGSLKIETLLFNMIILWIMILVLCITLYYNLLKKLIVFLESLNLPLLKKKFGREIVTP
jgi:hypothetical protein